MKTLASKTILFALTTALAIPAVAQVGSASKFAASSKLQSSQASKQGVSNGGGGTTVTINGERFLLDLVAHTKSFQSSSPGMKLPVTRAMTEFGVDSLDYSPVVQAILEKLERTKGSSPVMSSFLRQTVQMTKFFFVKGRVALKDPNYVIPAGSQIDPRTVETAAVYIPKFGAYISQPVFDSLNFKNQMALVVHESIRQAQITYGFNLSNSVLQSLTARVIEEASNLDDYNLLDGTFRTVLKDQVDDKQKTKSLMRELFPLASKYKVQLPAYNENTLFAMIQENPDLISEFRIFPRDTYGDLLSKATTPKQVVEIQRLWSLVRDLYWVNEAQLMTEDSMQWDGLNHDIQNVFQNVQLTVFLQEINEDGISKWPFSDSAKITKAYDQIFFGSGFFVK